MIIDRFAKIGNRLAFPAAGEVSWTGDAAERISFCLERQLYDVGLWRDVAELFGSDCDDANRGWRGEYWGKMMRGGCLVLRTTGDEKLAGILRDSVLDLLSRQRPDGSFRTYGDKEALHGWDVWSRKYVLTGLLHYYEICDDAALKERVLTAAKEHTDALTAVVGPGKVEICEASAHWLGVNSASFLEPLTELYMITGEERYKDFAAYIISTGGCTGGNLIDLALENKLSPYEYPETKAYETMSFFEGVLGWYRITGEEKYLKAVVNFAEAVAATDITVIGCSGCTHELFDHSAVRQTEYLEGIMQETCVSVTWMRLSAKLLLLTGERKYYDRIEISAYNALYGAENRANTAIFHDRTKQWLAPLPYDSYSPLYLGKRFRKTGGLQFYGTGKHYGCCAAIASAGVAVPPLTALMLVDGGIVFNGFPSGEFRVKLPSGVSVSGFCESDYPSGGSFRADLSSDGEFSVSVRVPPFCTALSLTFDGEMIPTGGDYVTVNVAAGAHTLAVRMSFDVVERKIAGREAFFYGPLTLAAGSMSQSGAQITDAVPEGAAARAEFLPREFDEKIRVRLPGGMILTDYASAAHYPGREGETVTVFFNVKKSTE